jgi:tetratricopeptide (TPR) repeat protein
MKYRYLITALLLLANALLYAQEDISIRKKEFKTVKPGFKVAWKHIKEGDRLYSDGGRFYSDALNEYLKANDYNNSNDVLNYKIGVCYLFSDMKDKAYTYLIKAYNINNNIAQDILFLSGMALQYDGKFSQALEKYQAFLAGSVKRTESLTSRANKRAGECKSAMEILKDTMKVDIQNAGKSINSDADEYSVIITSDGSRLYFASRKALNQNANNYHKDNKLDENIFTSQFTDGKWADAVPVGKNLMTQFSETPLFIDKSGEVLYIYVGYEGEGDIKYSEFRKGEWKPLKREPFGITSNEPETSFCISPSGDEIAFISDRGKNGYGGKDIFFVKRNEKKWSKPVNAGENVNSVFNEESVRYSVTGDTLWFASTGHNTIGGFDIFYTIRKGDGWGPAINAGYPVNTQWNDLFYLPSPVKSGQFYFVSDRSNGFGGLDIYTGTRNLPLKKAAPDKGVNLPVKDSVNVSDSSNSAAVNKENAGEISGIRDIDNIFVSGVPDSAGINEAVNDSSGYSSKSRRSKSKKN